MRYGQNPAKYIEEVHQPEKVTVAVICYIPFLTGYYTESLEVLKVCLGSLWENTGLPFDLMVFDNASCPEVREYLLDCHSQGRIQYLALSEKNIGKAGAWNYIFGAAPGEVIAYADSDIYFYPGWLEAQLKVLEAFPNAGMVTGMPLRTPEEFSTATVRWAGETPEACLERGSILSWEDYWRHARSLGASEQEARERYESSQDACLVSGGKKYFIGAGHFQFVAPRAVLRSVLPVRSVRPMGQVRLLDIAINEKGYLRLSTPEWWVRHIGNSLVDGEFTRLEKHTPQPGVTRLAKPWQRLFQWKPVRRVLLGLYGRIFELYFKA